MTWRGAECCGQAALWRERSRERSFLTVSQRGEKSLSKFWLISLRELPSSFGPRPQKAGTLFHHWHYPGSRWLQLPSKRRRVITVFIRRLQCSGYKKTLSHIIKFQPGVTVLVLVLQCYSVTVWSSPTTRTNQTHDPQSLGVFFFLLDKRMSRENWYRCTWAFKIKVKIFFHIKSLELDYR